MPIYEFACPKCRVIYNFFSKRVNPDRLPICPRCGNKKMVKEVSRFATLRGLKEPGALPDDLSLPDADDPRVRRAMNEMGREIMNLDENNPKDVARLMRKMKDLMPPGSTPQELDVAIKRLEAGEDPEKVEADMGDVLADFFEGTSGEASSRGGYARDEGLYDY